MLRRLPFKIFGGLAAVSAADYIETTQHHRTSREFWPQGVEEAYFERLNTVCVCVCVCVCVRTYKRIEH